MNVSTTVFACHSKACAPPPAGKGGSLKGPLSAAQIRSVLKDELSGTKAGTRVAYSHQMRGGGTVLSDGVSVRRLYKGIPWLMVIEADGQRNQQQLAAQFPAIRKKLKALGYGKIEPHYSYNFKTRVADKSKITMIYLDES